MLTGLYDAAAGMTASRQAYERVAENLAHLGVPGYRRHEIALEAVEGDTTTGRMHQEGPRVAASATDFTEGPLQSTSHPLDLAVLGSGFFVVEGPQGGELYTRNGAFQRDAEGNLATQSGLKVIGEGGPLNIPDDVSTPSIHIDPQGGLHANGQEIGRLKLVNFANPQGMERVGTTLFRATANMQPDGEVVSVQQGFREAANVSAVTELVNMVTAMRHYEASQRVMRAINDAVQQNTSPSA